MENPNGWKIRNIDKNEMKVQQLQTSTTKSLYGQKLSVVTFHNLKLCYYVRVRRERIDIEAPVLCFEEESN